MSIHTLWDQGSCRQLTRPVPDPRPPKSASNTEGGRSQSRPATHGPRSSMGMVIDPTGPMSVTSIPQGSVLLAAQSVTEDGTGRPSQVAGRPVYQLATPVGPVGPDVGARGVGLGGAASPGGDGTRTAGAGRRTAVVWLPDGVADAVVAVRGASPPSVGSELTGDMAGSGDSKMG